MILSKKYTLYIRVHAFVICNLFSRQVPRMYLLALFIYGFLFPCYPYIHSSISTLSLQLEKKKKRFPDL